jgi:cation diffusion facilitator family transporter
MHKGKKLHSPAIYADGLHLLMDVFSSFCVNAGVVLAVITKLVMLDSVIAFAVGLHLAYSAFKLIKDAIDGLMDASTGTADREKIHQLIMQYAHDALEYHALKIRRSGQVLFIDFHLVVLGEMSVRQAHLVCDAIEKN